MALIISTQIQLKPSNPLQNQILHPQVGFVTVRTKKTNCFSSDNVNHYRFKLRIGYKDSIFRTRVSDDSGAIPFQPSSSAVSFLHIIDFPFVFIPFHSRFILRFCVYEYSDRTLMFIRSFFLWLMVFTVKSKFVAVFVMLIVCCAIDIK